MEKRQQMTNHQQTQYVSGQFSASDLFEKAKMHRIILINAERKEEPILQMGSSDNTTAIEAARILRQKSWLQDGSLKGAYLDSANLQGAYLNGANLQGVYFWEAHLEGAKLAGANLEGTKLLHANLQGAEFDMHTTLPDGSKWAEGRDMRQFTHPDEWQAKQQTKKDNTE